MENLQRFLELNEGRKFKFALIENEKGEVEEKKNIVACGQYTFIGRLSNSDMCEIFTIDPIRLDRNSASIPMEFLNEGVTYMLFDSNPNT